MSDVNKVVTTWSGFPGSPGYTTMYFDGGATPPLAALKTFWATFVNVVPPAVTLNIASSGVGLNLGTGKPDGFWSGTAQTATTGTATGTWAAPCGLEIEWRTGQFSNGREFRAKSFIVPIVSPAYDTDGTIQGGIVNQVNAAAAALIAATPKLGCWSKTKHTFASATSARCLDKAVVLRSRRPR